jgi:small conductance mechanosensitive channel
MKTPFRRHRESDDPHAERNLMLDRMFETRSEAWQKVGLAVGASQRAVRSAQRRSLVLVSLFVAVVVLHDNYLHWFHLNHKHHHSLQTLVTVLTVIAVLAIGLLAARDVGRAAAPTFFRRMDPATAGTVGFVIRLVTAGIVLVWSLYIAGVSASSLIAGSAFTAVILGLAAQQTLGNVFAGMVLLSARPFRVGERVRLQAGGVGGYIEGVVSSLGLLYTTFARGEDRIMVPNNVVLAAVVVPLREPNPVDVKVTLSAGIRPSHVQAILDDQVSTATRSEPRVVLEEIDGDEVVVRVHATPERSADGARLADEIIAALGTVTGEHAIQRD